MNMICISLKRVHVSPDCITLIGNTPLTIKACEIYDYSLLAGAMYLQMVPEAYKRYKQWKEGGAPWLRVVN